MSNDPSVPSQGSTPEATAQKGDSAVAKRAFLAHLRHELCTPINAILGYSEMLIEDAEGAGKEIARDLKRIRGAGSQLLDLVNRLLDPGHLEISAAPLDLVEFEAQLRHNLRVPLNTVIGYSEMLIENALEVDDTELVADLQKIHGAGHQLTEMIGEAIRLSQIEEEAVHGKGTFEVSHLVRDAIASLGDLGKPVQEEDGRGGRVLVVDDSATNRDLLQRRLSREGYVVSTAENGLVALERLETDSYDLVLLDLMMPELNGYEVLRRLKADPLLRHLPVIMISAIDEVDSVVRCIELGAEDYLSKPFNPVLLQARISASMERKRLRDREQAYLEQLRVERERSEQLLLNILPQPIAQRLKAGETEIADSFDEVTVLFADLVNFTVLSAQLSPVELVRRLNIIFSAFDALAERHGLEKIKTLGDAYLVVGGLPSPRSDHAEAMAEMALEMMEVAERIASETGNVFRMRIGMHSGPVVAGVIGTRKFAYDLWGDTVNTASRMESHGVPGAIHVSEATRARLERHFLFTARGPIEIKGKGAMNTFLLTGRAGE